MASTMTNFGHLQIPLEEVVNATNNFHVDNIIGQGGYGTTYKGGLLWSGRLMKVVARRFNCKHDEADIEFLTEVSILADLKHTNLVSIIGFCVEKVEKIIVTTYEANGSLRQYLNNPNLTWTQRLRIGVGVARALSYLHNDEGRRDYAILHCNINSDAIVLDENWEAKLSCFEISIQPSVCCKSDIYSFGVVLFEMLCGREAFTQNEAKSFVAPLVNYHYENKKLRDIIYPDLHWKQRSPQSLLKYLNIAYSCLNEDREDRLNMDYVVDELEKALKLQLRRESIEKKFEYLKIPLTDIKLATYNFSDAYTIASWDDYTLYRAKLDHFDKENVEHPKGHNTVVIKRYPYGHDVYDEQGFYTEIEMLSSVKHPDIVTLLGFCVEGSEMILVAQNVSNGYLRDYLEDVNDMRILTWEKRLKICIDVAHALKYLHSEMEDQKMIIHRDITSTSIALDENWGAKIVDFWWSVFLPPNQEDEALYLNWIGRDSYIDPEYKKTCKLKRESDVYSFGVVLLEILCGRSAVNPIYLKESDIGLAHVARRNFYTGTLEDMIDPILMEKTSENTFVLNKRPNMDSLHTFIEIAHQCVAETQDQRPTMIVVVKELEKALLFQVPTQPKVNDQSVISVKETISANYIDQPNPDTDESDKCLNMSESQKKEVEDYVHAYRSPAREVFMNWTSKQREYFVVLCHELQINPEDMDDEEGIAS